MSDTIDNHIEFVGTNSEIQGLLGFLMHTRYKSEIGEMVSMTGDINVDITVNGVLALTFMTENSPADLLVRAINNHFPKLKIEGGFHFDNETTLWKDELGLDEEQK